MKSNISLARVGFAKSRDKSPARRGVMSYGRGRPVMSSIAFKISRLLMPFPVPKFNSETCKPLSNAQSYAQVHLGRRYKCQTPRHRQRRKRDGVGRTLSKCRAVERFYMALSKPALYLWVPNRLSLIHISEPTRPY